MALNLARMGAIQRQDAEDFDPFAEAEARRKARREEQLVAMNLSKLEREAKRAEAEDAEADRLRKEAEGARAVRGRYVRRREGVPDVESSVNLSAIGKQPAAPEYPTGMNPALQGEIPEQIRPSVIERDAVLDLANINPDLAESFRGERQAERISGEDRTRRIEGEAADRAFKERQQDELQAYRQAMISLKRQGLVPGSVVGATDGLRVPKGMKVSDVLKARDAKANTIYAIKQTEDVAKRLLGHKGLKGLTGATGFLAPVLVGTRYKDANAIKNQLKALAGFSALQEMRAASPTGGALGPVSDTENKLLQDSKVALENSQTPEQYRANLEAYIAQLQISQKRIEDAWMRDFGGGGLGIEDDPNDWEAVDE